MTTAQVPDWLFPFIQRPDFSDLLNTQEKRALINKLNTYFKNHPFEAVTPEFETALDSAKMNVERILEKILTNMAKTEES